MSNFEPIFNSKKRYIKYSESFSLRGEGAPAFTEPGYQDDQDDDTQVVGPQDLDSNATEVDKFPKSVGVFKNSSWNLRVADDIGQSEFGNPIDYNENRMQSLEAPGLEIKTPLDSGKRNYTEQRQDANPLTLRSWFTGDDVNGPWPHTKNLSGPLDFEATDDQNRDSTGPIMGSNKLAHNDNHPWPITNDEAIEHIISHHEALVDACMQRFNESHGEAVDRIRKHRRFRGSDGKAYSPIDSHVRHHKDPEIVNFYPPTHEHDEDGLDVDIPDNIDTWMPTYITAHFEDIVHPWPQHIEELLSHVISHHQNFVNSAKDPQASIDPENVQHRKELAFGAAFRYDPKTAFEAHTEIHQGPRPEYNGPHVHKHGDDKDINVDVPENIESIEPIYITSSWHQSFVEVIPTHQDEESEDSLLNPADELKNGRPRANDLPQQSAQLIPGMLVDHDQMGGSGTDTASF